MFHSRRAHQGRHYRPYLEILETRDLLSTYVATGTPAQRPGSSPPRRRASARRLTAESNAGQGLRDGIRHFGPRLRRGCWLLRNSFDFVDALKAFRGIRSIEVCNGPSAIGDSQSPLDLRCRPSGRRPLIPEANRLTQNGSAGFAAASDKFSLHFLGALQTLRGIRSLDMPAQERDELGISRSTLLQYVTMLYRHFGVTTRSALLIHCLPRYSTRVHSPVWRN